MSQILLHATDPTALHSIHTRQFVALVLHYPTNDSRWAAQSNFLFTQLPLD